MTTHGVKNENPSTHNLRRTARCGTDSTSAIDEFQGRSIFSNHHLAQVPQRRIPVAHQSFDGHNRLAGWGHSRVPRKGR